MKRMYLHNPTYDLDELAYCNYHIHTNLSRCGKSEMVLTEIVKLAESYGLREIAITDHIHPGEAWKLSRNLPILKDELSGIKTGVRVYIGAELSAYGEGRYTLKNTFSSQLQYRLYSHNHYHMFAWETPGKLTANNLKEHCLRVMTEIIQSGKADCLAHPFNDYFIVREFGEQTGLCIGDVTSLWTDTEIGDIMSLGRDCGCAWEINTKACFQSPEFMYRYYNIGKEVGVCFNYGTDAHTLSRIDTRQDIDEVKRILTR